jgi:D-alanine transaminase/branched-chain amino acid aminotransferase
MEPEYYVNGEILPASNATLKINDLTLLRGYGIFDFFRTSGGKPFLMDNYLDRFSNSAALMDLKLPVGRDKIKEIVLELLDRNRFEESGIRMVLTGGYSEDGFTPGDPNFFILVEPIHFPDEKYYLHGIKLITYEHLREWSGVKSINYLTPIKIRKDIEQNKGYDVLYYFNGNILEVSRSNFFIIRDKTLVTPEKNVLHGITRKTVLNLARDILTVEERDLSLKELTTASEAFITGTTKRVMPVTNIDDRIIGIGEPGPETKKLMEIFREFEKSYQAE